METYKCHLYDYDGDMSKRWRIEWYLPNPNFKAGNRFSRRNKRFRKRIPMRLNKKERYAFARRYKAMKQAELDALIKDQSAAKAISGKGKIMLLDAMDLAYEWKMRDANLADKTVSSYKTMFNTFRKWAAKEGQLNRMLVKTFSNEHAMSFLFWLQRHHGVGDNTYNSYRTFLSSLFKILRKQKILTENPWTDVPCRQAHVRTKRLITDEQYKHYINWLKKEDYGMFVMATLIRSTLVRPRELIRCRVHQVDLERQLIFITIKESKRKKDRTPVIPDKVVPLLEYLKYRKANDYIFGPDLMPGKKQIRMNDLWERHREYVRSMELPDFWTLYKNKHYGNYLYARSGVPLHVIQSQNGHTSMKTTEVYLNSVPMMNEAYKALKNVDI